MTIRADIRKIIDGIKDWQNKWKEWSERRKTVPKKRSLWFSHDNVYWQNLKNEINDPLADSLIDQVILLGSTGVEYEERVSQILEVLDYEPKDPDFEGKDSSDPHIAEKLYWTKLEEELKKARDDGITWWSLVNMVDIIIEVKKHLGISDDELDELTVNTDLAMPTKKVGGVNSKLILKELISVYNKLGLANPQEILGGGVSGTDKLGGSDFSKIPNGQNLKNLIDNYNTVSGLTNGRSLNELIDEANRYQKLNTEFHDIQEKLESQKDYNEIKTKNEKLERQKTEIISELGLPKNATEQQVIDKIKELMGRPTNSDYNNLETEVENKRQKISELENDNKKNTDSNNVITKKVLVETTNTNLEDWGIKISNEQKVKIQNAGSAQEVETMKNEIIKNRMSELKTKIDNSFYLNLVLGILTLTVLILLGWMIARQTNLLKVKSSQKRF